MAKIKWLGGPGEPASNDWNGHTFPKGEWVEVSDAYMVKKAKGNPFYEVDDPQGDNLAKAREAKAAKAKNAPEKIDA